MRWMVVPFATNPPLFDVQTVEGKTVIDRLDSYQKAAMIVTAHNATLDHITARLETIINAVQRG